MKKLLLLASLLGLGSCSDVPTAPSPSAATAPGLSYLPSASSGVIPNRYIVRFRDDEPNVSARAHAIERSHGAVVDRVFTSVMKGASMTITDSAAEALRADKNVLLVEQDQAIHEAATQANPPWGLDRIDQVNLPYSGSYTYNATGAGVTVYILDSGINFTHADFGGRASAGIDEVVPGGAALDCDGHGTHVAGTIGGTTFGVAKSVSLVAVRVLDCNGNGTLSGLIAGIDWITQHAVKPAVANVSIASASSTALDQAVQNSIAAGVVYVVAAGNTASDACARSPGRTPSAITVAASDSTDAFASFSNFGTCIDLIAPGTNIRSDWMNMPAINGSGSSTGITFSPGANSATVTYSGTSMAAAHVSGAAALYLSTSPAATPAQVALALVGNATMGVITGVPAGTPNALLYTGFIGGGGQNQPPVASFTFTCGITLPAACLFNAGASTDDHGIVSYGWNFGNGTSTTVATPTTTATYASGGTYTVTLTVTDGGGLTNVLSKQVTIAGTPNQAPTASISSPAAGATAVQGTAVSFAGTGTDPEDGALSGASLVWTSSIDGAIGTGTSFSKSNLSVGTHTITLTATDSKGATGTATRSITITAPQNQPPTASITSPANNSSSVQGTAVSFAGTGTDPEDGALTGASLVWTSSIDGAIGTGSSFSKSNLSVGTHTITLKATDANGASSTAQVTITVTTPANQAPTASITSPTNNSSVVQGTAVAFNGSGSDPEDGALTGASLVWTSSLDGAIGTGTSFSKSNLSVGTHTITLTVTDSKGATGTATRTLTITAPPNQPPVASISSPSNNTSVVQGTTLSFSGTGNDPEDGALAGASLVWRSSIDGVIGTGGSFSKSNLSVGTHTITLTATDSKGATGTASVTVTVAANQPPTASISSPANNSSVVQGTAVTFSGSGSDPEDGTLTGASLTWTSSRDGALGTGASFTRSNLSVGTHTITLTATDSKGAARTASVTITVTAASTNQPPVARFTWTCAGQASPTQCAFDGSTSTDDAGVVSWAWNWGNGRSEVHSVPTARNTFATGTYTVTLTVTDAGGLTSSFAQQVTTGAAMNQSPTASITTPANNASSVQGKAVSFAGTGSDPEDGALNGASLVWTSSLDGVIGTGTSFSKSNLSIGTHTITLTATDSKGAKGTATITVVVVANQPPTASIAAPANNSSAVQGAPVSFSGTGTDPEDGSLSGASLVWTSSIDGVIGTGGAFSKSNLSVGTHTITLKATDSQGASGTAQVTITIAAPNQPPTASITAPANNASVVQGTSITFTGSGTDPEDGALAGASLVWTSSLDGVIGTGTSFSKSNLSIGTHTITLTATDSKGAKGTATITVVVVANQPPTASIAAPANNTSVVQGTTLSFSGTGNDPEDGSLSGASLVWTSSIDGVIGTGTSFSKSTLSVGTHTITLTATDSKGATGTATITVTVTAAPPVNQPPVASFTWTCTGQANPHQCVLDGSSSTDDHGIVSWTWNWGNGRAAETKTASTARNTWATPGTYQVTLTVKDASGLTNTSTQSVVVP